MNTIAIRCIAVILIAMLSVGCATQLHPNSDGEDTTVATALPDSTSSGKGSKQFPSSQDSPKGKAWKTMGKHAFTGSIGEACTELELDEIECSTYKYRHSNGLCEYMDVPNGVVLDGLTYTHNDVHRTQRDVLVALQDPPTRKTEVCDLGDGVYALRFLGCGNHAVVREFFIREPKPEKESSAPQTEAACISNPVYDVLPGNRGYIFFPSVEDHDTMVVCNQKTDCVTSSDCEDWVANDMQEGAKVRAVTGQRMGMTLAQRNPPKLPAELHGPIVICWQGTDEYWTLMPDGTLLKGIHSQQKEE